MQIALVAATIGIAGILEGHLAAILYNNTNQRGNDKKEIKKRK